jgi:hypothetical protein
LRWVNIWGTDIANGFYRLEQCRPRISILHIALNLKPPTD